MAENQSNANDTEECGESETNAGVSALEELRGFNGVKLADKLSQSDEDFDKWLMNAKLLSSSRFCDCGSAMSLYVSR
ncbi:unnamed protein product [Toxocara canis]|uniref:Uncharacterized protein n=1 Tax=Toxocara canis TaxID=6265 RepID=A0A183UF69_TOXCA|nr:unnamed protein product [Toxocara canis]